MRTYRVLGLRFLKIGGTLLGVPIIRVIIYWGLYWGFPYLGELLFRIISTPNLRPFSYHSL